MIKNIIILLLGIVAGGIAAIGVTELCRRMK